MKNSTFGHVTHWNVAIKEEVRAQNDEDLGEVLDIRGGIVVTERGTLNKEKFYLPMSIRHGFNDHALLFDVIEEQAKNRFSGESTMTQGAKIELKQPEFTTAAESDIPMPVIEEKLVLSKKETIQEAPLINEPLMETKTIEVELKHEDLIIEERPLEKRSSSSNSEGVGKTEITIPLKKEDIIVEKKPYVKEKVVINKRELSETKTISEQLVSEKISVRNHESEQVREEK